MPGFAVFAQFRGKETSDWDTKYVSELGKISSLTYEKLADHDRIPLRLYHISLDLYFIEPKPYKTFKIFSDAIWQVSEDPCQ